MVNALLPAMGTIPASMLIGLSTPYARHGVLWEKFRDHYGHDGDVLVWSADVASDESDLEPIGGRSCVSG